MGGRWTMDDRRWMGAHVLPLAPSRGGEIMVVGHQAHFCKEKNIITHNKSMPHRGNILVEKIKIHITPIPHRGYPLVITTIAFRTPKTKTNA
jgi:hypothetical protein